MLRTGDTCGEWQAQCDGVWSEPQALYVCVMLIDRGCTGGVPQQRSSAYGMINNAAADGRCWQPSSGL
jgi:hypothetical protein